MKRIVVTLVTILALALTACGDNTSTASKSTNESRQKLDMLDRSEVVTPSDKEKAARKSEEAAATEEESTEELAEATKEVEESAETTVESSEDPEDLQADESVEPSEAEDESMSEPVDLIPIPTVEFEDAPAGLFQEEAWIKYVTSEYFREDTSWDSTLLVDDYHVDNYIVYGEYYSDEEYLGVQFTYTPFVLSVGVMDMNTGEVLYEYQCDSAHFGQE